jgi:hypothetical protein
MTDGLQISLDPRGYLYTYATNLQHVLGVLGLRSKKARNTPPLDARRLLIPIPLRTI